MSDSSGSAAQSFVKRVKTLCTTFEQSWKAGRRIRIEELIASRSEPERSAALRSLLNLELELLDAEGVTPDEASYRQRFPEHGDVVSDVFQSRRKIDAGRPSSESRSVPHRTTGDTGRSKRGRS